MIFCKLTKIVVSLQQLLVNLRKQVLFWIALPVRVALFYSLANKC